MPTGLAPLPRPPVPEGGSGAPPPEFGKKGKGGFEGKKGKAGGPEGKKGKKGKGGPPPTELSDEEEA